MFLYLDYSIPWNSFEKNHFHVRYRYCVQCYLQYCSSCFLYQVFFVCKAFLNFYGSCQKDKLQFHTLGMMMPFSLQRKGKATAAHVTSFPMPVQWNRRNHRLPEHRSTLPSPLPERIVVGSGPLDWTACCGGGRWTVWESGHSRLHPSQKIVPM